MRSGFVVLGSCPLIDDLGLETHEISNDTDFVTPEGRSLLHCRSNRWGLGEGEAPASLVAEIDAWKPVTMTAEQAAAATIDGGGTVQAHGGGLYVGANPASPAIGDLRVTFQMVPATVVSLISQQTGSTFQPWTTSRGGTVEELALGTKSMEQMFQAAHDANTMLTWIHADDPAFDYANIENVTFVGDLWVTDLVIRPDEAMALISIPDDTAPGPFTAIVELTDGNAALVDSSFTVIECGGTDPGGSTDPNGGC